MTTYAIRTDLPPTPRNAERGARQTGWVHEGKPPWRVITSTDADSLPLGKYSDSDFQITEYAGIEATIDISELIDDG